MPLKSCQYYFVHSCEQFSFTFLTWMTDQAFHTRNKEAMIGTKCSFGHFYIFVVLGLLPSNQRCMCRNAFQVETLQFIDDFCEIQQFAMKDTFVHDIHR